ncbi:hypothetical protein [Mycobacteroides franklinii]|nr:hypothetical protein [Mycobacteroides franklinii]
MTVPREANRAPIEISVHLLGPITYPLGGCQMTMPQPQFGHPGATRPNGGSSTAVRLLVVSLLLVFVLGYGLAVFLAFTSASYVTLGATTMSMVLRVAIVALGIAVTAVAILAVIYLVRRRKPEHVSA